MKRLSVLFAAFCLILLVTASSARAQQFDVAFGFGSLGGNAASSASAADIASGAHTPDYIGGGGYPSFSGDFLFFRKYFGVGGQVAWRAHQNLNVNQQAYRPILYNFDGVFAPPIGKRAQGEFQAGIGAESLRFYQGFFQCNFVGCTNYVTSNHFLGHFGAGVRLYVTRNIFIRPEAHVYLVNNNFEFAGPRVTRYAVSIGYSLKNQF